MDHSDYPMLNPSPSRPGTRPNGRDGLELFSFLFALTNLEQARRETGEKQEKNKEEIERW